MSATPQVEGKAGNAAKSASLCHTTLSRQLLTDQLDRLDWSKNCAILSQFYINQDNYTSARYHLAAARTIFDKHFPPDSSHLDQDQRENIAQCGAHISRLCGKYGLNLLEFSRNNSLLAKMYQAIEDVENPQDEAIENPEFEKLDVSERLDEVTDVKITDWDEAKRSFLWAQKHLISSQSHFSLEEHCSDYVESQGTCTVV